MTNINPSDCNNCCMYFPLSNCCNCHNKAWHELNETKDALLSAKELAEKDKEFLEQKVKEYETALKQIKYIAGQFDYWNNNLSEASEIISNIEEEVNEVLNEPLQEN